MKKILLIIFVFTPSTDAQQNGIDIKLDALPSVVYEYCPMYLRVDIENKTNDTVTIIEMMNTVLSYGVLVGKKNTYRSGINVNEVNYVLAPHSQTRQIYRLDLYGAQSKYSGIDNYLKPDRYRGEFVYKYYFNKTPSDTSIERKSVNITILKNVDPSADDILTEISAMKQLKDARKAYENCLSLGEVYRSSPLKRKIYKIAFFYASLYEGDEQQKLNEIKKYIVNNPWDGLSYRLLNKLGSYVRKLQRYNRRVVGGNVLLTEDLYDIYTKCNDVKLKEYIEKRFINRSQTGNLEQ